MRHFSDFVLLLDYDFNSQLQNNIIKLQSVTHIQFSSTRYHNFKKYSWFNSGYIIEKNLPKSCERHWRLSLKIVVLSLH